VRHIIPELANRISSPVKEKNREQKIKGPKPPVVQIGKQAGKKGVGFHTLLKVKGLIKTSTGYGPAAARQVPR
jgi:hypothetical protein